MNRRVVVTGMGIVSPLGLTLNDTFNSLKSKRNFVKHMEEWEKIEGLHTKLASPIENFTIPEHYTRKQTRSMGRTSVFAVRASELALKDAGLLGSSELENGLTGVAYGSSSGSVDSFYDFYSILKTNTVSGITSSSYIRMMPHTCPVNISVFFKLTGRLIPTGTACTSGSLGVGYGYEAIKYGHQDIMLAGGSEELSPTQAVVFDVLFATSTKNNTPGLTPRPYDKDRDGLVVGEGGATLVLEEYEHAIRRGAKIYAEVVGFATNTDGAHVTQPNKTTMSIVMKKALLSASLPPESIGYINGHGTATTQGDVAETHAVDTLFNRKMPISSQKSYIGHTLGACGAIESILSILMMNDNWYAPTVNLENIDPECADLEYIQSEGVTMDNEYVMNNNFAFGGINSSLIFKKIIL
ncbi:MAG: beta-ketoacyl-ACP synthase [Deferribacteraceae bacterium]|nr:beta-ketoacyl-ACP synthase [Deferribacteraceae bacterium]